MASVAETNQRVRGLFGSGFVGWVMMTGAMLAPEWTREGEKHCGVIFCCNTTYGDCTLTDSAVFADKFSWIFASWISSFVAICSTTCKCSNVKKENVRQMAVLLVLAGVLGLTGSIEFFVQKFTQSQLHFAPAGFVANGAAWIFFISGCCGYCHGYGYQEEEMESTQVYPMDMPGGFWGGLGGDRFSRFAPVEFARRKLRDIQINKSNLSQA